MLSPGVRFVGVHFPANGKFYLMGGRAFDGGGDLTVTLGVSRSEERVAIVDAASHDAITLIRTTHVGRRSPPAAAGEDAGGAAT